MIINLHNIDIDDAKAQRLLQIARRHCKLALEHLGKEVSQVRRQAIRAEIERLRVERECLLDSFVQEGLA